MFAGKVKRAIWPERINPDFQGYKLVELAPLRFAANGEVEETDNIVIAVDFFQSRENSRVICGTGSRIRELLSDREIPFKCFILGLIDEMQVC